VAAVTAVSLRAATQMGSEIARANQPGDPSACLNNPERDDPEREGQSHPGWVALDTRENISDEVELRKRAALLDLANDAIFVTELDGTITYWNQGAERLYGWTPAEAVGKDEVKLLRAEFPLAHDELISTFLHQGHWEGEVTRYRKNGESLIVSSRWSLLRDNHGTPVARMVINTDLTATKLAFDELRRAEVRDKTTQKSTEAALHRSQSQFRMVFDSDLIGVGCGDKSGLMTDANDKFLGLVGYTREDLHMGRVRWDEMTPPEYASIDTAGMVEAAERGSCTPYEKEFIRKNGSRIPILIGYALEKSAGLFIGFILDLSAQKLAEAALREREKRFRALAESLPQFIWTADTKGVKTYCNQPYLEYTGAASLAEMSSTWQEFVHADDRRAAAEAWNHSLSTGQPYLREYRLRRKDGVFRHHLARAVPLRNEAGEIEQWLGSLTDIHDQKTGEAVLRRAEKLAATGRLAASMAHEINNPLNAVNNVLFLALQDPTLTDATRKYLRLAEHQLARVASVTTQALKFHKQSSKGGPADLCELMDSALAVIAPRLEESSIAVKREYNCAQKLYCHDSELRQVFANLLSNSLDAIGRGGRIRIRIRLAHAWDSRGTRGIRVTLGDTGCGIPNHLRRQIFEPFVSSREATSTGLGLWVTEGIMLTHHGRISLRSNTNPQTHGTVFSLFFPFVGLAE
jgi:PAS domain S-box-containing protein